MPTTDLYAEDFPHGTPAGYDRGCRGAACEHHADPDWLSCKEAKFRRAGDYSLREHPLDQRIPRDRLASTPTNSTPISRPIPQPSFAEPITTLVVDTPGIESEEPMPEQPAQDRPGGVALEKHGTYAGYVAGCRLADAPPGDVCPGVALVGQSCRAGQRAYQRDLAARKKVALAEVRETPAAADQAEPHPVTTSEAPTPAAYVATDTTGATPLATELTSPPPAPEPVPPREPPAEEIAAAPAGLTSDAIAVTEAADQLERGVVRRTSTSRAGSAASGGDTSTHRTLELTIILDGQQLAALTVTANKSTAEIHHDMDGLVVVARTW